MCRSDPEIRNGSDFTQKTDKLKDDADRNTLLLCKCYLTPWLIFNGSISADYCSLFEKYHLIKIFVIFNITE